MLWAGTGVVWTVAGGVPASRLIGSAKAAESGFSKSRTNCLPQVSAGEKNTSPR
jgi:hypothetical protein